MANLTDLIAAAEERGWVPTFVDTRANAIVLEEPIAQGVTLRLSGRGVDDEFIRTLPIARMPQHAEVAEANRQQRWAELRPGVAVAEDDGDPT